MQTHVRKEGEKAIVVWISRVRAESDDGRDISLFKYVHAARGSIAIQKPADYFVYPAIREFMYTGARHVWPRDGRRGAATMAVTAQPGLYLFQRTA